MADGSDLRCRHVIMYSSTVVAGGDEPRPDGGFYSFRLASYLIQCTPIDYRYNGKKNIIMIRQFKFWATALLILLTMLTQQSCSYIDDDRSDCETSYSLTYKLEVVSNINMQLREQLKADAGSLTLKTLNNYFTSVFQPSTTEARLGFYPLDGAAPVFFKRNIQGLRSMFSISINIIS